MIKNLEKIFNNKLNIYNPFICLNTFKRKIQTI